MTESAAKQRAAARRQAILSRGTDRLGKLTHAARGEEGAALFDTSSSQTSNFIGEETISMPTPPPVQRVPSNPRMMPRDYSPAAEDPPWPEQQQQFMHAMMSGPSPAQAGAPGDPLQAMMSALLNNGPGGFPDPSALNSGQMPALPAGFPAFPPSMGASHPSVAVLPTPRTLYQRFAPLLHICSILALLVFFVARFEPSVHSGRLLPVHQTLWERWAALRWGHGGEWGVGQVPLFYAFTTLQVLLHSIRIYSEPPPAPPSGLLGMAVMHLPQPFPGYITGILRYGKMGSAVLDDLSVLLFAVGVVVWVAGWAVP